MTWASSPPQANLLCYAVLCHAHVSCQGADPLLVVVWQADLVKDPGFQYFIRYLDVIESKDYPSKAQAAFVLAVTCDRHPKGQARRARAW
jgi:hypothetical protein